MRIIIPVFFTLFFLASCKPSDKEIHTDQQGVATLNPHTPVTYAGHWLNKTYYDLVLEKKSPRDAQEKVENSFIRIPAYTNDTTAMVYGFHESGPDIVVVQKPQETELWEVQGDSLDRMAFKVTEIDQNTLLIGTDTFIRINPVQTKYNPLILEEILFKGKYQLKGGGEVEFKNSGEVTGLGKYKHYKVLMDYLDAGLDVDQVGLGENPDSLDYYGFKMKDNTLELFHLKCLEKGALDERCQRVAFGKSAYKLTKKE